MELRGPASQPVLRELFHQDLAAALYMAADLAPPLFAQCQWFVDCDVRPAAVVTVFHGLETPALVAFGDVPALHQIAEVHAHDFPARCYAKLSREHMPVFDRVYEYTGGEQINVMMLGELVSPSPLPDVVLREIAPADPLQDILDVYRDYPGNFFEAAQLATGRYAGAWRGERLVSIAGTHAYAPSEGVAALGNVATAADARGCGLATAVTAFLCGRLRASGCDHIGLHVERDNAPAIAAYQRCGFVTTGPPLTQRLATRKP